MLGIVPSSKSSAELDREKQAVAHAAVGFVRNDMILGLGSGSTATYFVNFLAERVRSAGFKIRAVASSLGTAALAKKHGIEICEPQRGVRIDLTIDGADEIAPDLSLVKGAGGALLREKIVAYASLHFVVIGDSSKRVEQLGRRLVPLEVTPFATPWVMDDLEKLDGKPALRMEESRPGRPHLTDQQNHIVDCDFGLIWDPRDLATKLKTIPGVVEHGLFLGLASEALVAEGDKILVLRAGQAPSPFSESDIAID